MHTYVSNKLSQANNVQIHRMIREEMSKISELLSGFFLEKKRVHMNMCLIWNGYRDRAVSIPRPNSVRFLFVGLDEERSYKRKVDIRDELLARISDAAARIKKNEDKLRRKTRDLLTRIAKYFEVVGGIFEYLLRTVMNLSSVCNKFVS